MSEMEQFHLMKKKWNMGEYFRHSSKYCQCRFYIQYKDAENIIKNTPPPKKKSYLNFVCTGGLKICNNDYPLESLSTKSSLSLCLRTTPDMLKFHSYNFLTPDTEMQAAQANFLTRSLAFQFLLHPEFLFPSPPPRGLFNNPENLENFLHLFMTPDWKKERKCQIYKSSVLLHFLSSFETAMVLTIF